MQPRIYNFLFACSTIHSWRRGLFPKLTKEHSKKEIYITDCSLVREAHKFGFGVKTLSIPNPQYYLHLALCTKRLSSVQSPDQQRRPQRRQRPVQSLLTKDRAWGEPTLNMSSQIRLELSIQPRLLSTTLRGDIRRPITQRSAITIESVQ